MKTYQKGVEAVRVKGKSRGNQQQETKQENRRYNDGIGSQELEKTGGPEA